MQGSPGRTRRTHDHETLAHALGTRLALLLAAGAALGGQQARITGKATDGKGVPLADVKITITTKALTNFKVELKTDKDGKWGTILNDSTITYHYKFEKQGYIGVEQDKKVPIGESGDRSTSSSSRSSRRSRRAS